MSYIEMNKNKVIEICNLKILELCEKIDSCNSIMQKRAAKEKEDFDSAPWYKKLFMQYPAYDSYPSNEWFLFIRYNNLESRYKVLLKLAHMAENTVVISSNDIGLLY